MTLYVRIRSSILDMMHVQNLDTATSDFPPLLRHCLSVFGAKQQLVFCCQFGMGIDDVNHMLLVRLLLCKSIGAV